MKKKENKGDRFSYDSMQGLSLVSRSKNSDKEEKKTIKKGQAEGETIFTLAQKHNAKPEVILVQVEMGIEVEKEHTDDEREAEKIAMDHVFESPEYYTKLRKMEESFKNE